MTEEQLWQATLGELEMLISKANFNTWFCNTFLIEVGENKVIIGVPNGFTKAWMETKYHPAIVKTLKNVTKRDIVTVEYRVETRRHPAATFAGQTPRAAAPLPTAPSGGANKVGLNPTNSFQHFIVGKGSELAFAAAKAVAERPGQVYNPLFIYGGVGLGKTHLMQAIGNDILLRDPRKKILYVSSERFTNEFIQAVSHGNAEKFKNFYRGVDVLLIDDIHFLSGKEGTQEEFFHTFNCLHEAGKQIVVTSDRPPKSIPSLEARLVSRFEWGMVADIAQPDLETRIAILEAKCREKNHPLNHEILYYVASAVQSNVRELEGALNRIIAYHDLNKTTPDLDAVKSLLGALTQSNKRSGVTPKHVINIVSQFYDISLDLLLGAGRKKELVEPRQVAMFLLREELHCSFPSIGHELGDRDHTTAMHACDKISRQQEKEEKLKQDLVVLRQRIYA